MSRRNQHRPYSAGLTARQHIHATQARERNKAAISIGRQSLALASRARAAGLTELARLLETIALEAAAGTHSDKDV